MPKVEPFLAPPSASRSAGSLPPSSGKKKFDDLLSNADAKRAEKPAPKPEPRKPAKAAKSKSAKSTEEPTQAPADDLATAEAPAVEESDPAAPKAETEDAAAATEPKAEAASDETPSVDAGAPIPTDVLAISIATTTIAQPTTTPVEQPATRTATTDTASEAVPLVAFAERATQATKAVPTDSPAGLDDATGDESPDPLALAASGFSEQPDADSEQPPSDQPQAGTPKPAQPKPVATQPAAQPAADAPIDPVRPTLQPVSADAPASEPTAPIETFEPTAMGQQADPTTSPDADRAAALPSQPAAEKFAPAPASAKPAAAAPPPAPEAHFADANHDKIVTSVRTQLSAQGNASMQIRLDPPELGALKVSIEMANGQMTATFQTSNEEATRLLSHSLNQLKHVLESQGVSVDRLQVQQAPKNEQSAQRDSNPQQQQEQAEDHAARQEQQRKEMLKRMWRKVSGIEDPIDFLA